MKTFFKLLLAAAAIFGVVKLAEAQRQLPPPDEDIWKPATPAPDAT